jgi:hypothetical protein
VGRIKFVDSCRVLLRNGSTGGNLEDVRLKKTPVAGIDRVALDACVAEAYWNMDVSAMPSKNGQPAKFGPARF